MASQRRDAAIVGIHEYPLRVAPGVSAMQIKTDSILAALGDAGLSLGDVDAVYDTNDGEGGGGLGISASNRNAPVRQTTMTMTTMTTSRTTRSRSMAWPPGIESGFRLRAASIDGAGDCCTPQARQRATLSARFRGAKALTAA